MSLVAAPMDSNKQRSIQLFVLYASFVANKHAHVCERACASASVYACASVTLVATYM